MSSSSPFSSRNVTLALSTPHPAIRSTTNTHPPSPAQSPNLLLSASFPSPTHHLRVLSASRGSPNYILEESRWLREEQWWLCEEQRWFHEERRWACEEEFLLGEIARPKLRIQALEWEIQILGGVHGEVANVAVLLQERNLIVERGLSASPMLLGGERGGGDGGGREGDCSGEELLRSHVLGFTCGFG
ncbi:hypothetical protein NL676_022604 [Syzygium grande]|nr:hypothetical protein NL676_022604 [Syzygium grande]